MISVLVTTHNHPKTVEKLTQNLSFVSEIIIVDSCDFLLNTSSLNEIPIKINIISKKNSIQKIIKTSSFDWIFVYDIYDTISENLKVEISEIIKTNTTEAFEIKKDFSFMEKKINHGAYNESTIPSLFLKGKNFNKIKSKTLKNKITDKSYEGFDTYNKTISLQSIATAEELYKSNYRPTLFDLLLKPFGYFFKHYFIKLGFLDGKEGFILAYIYAFGVFKKYIQLWTLYRNIN